MEYYMFLLLLSIIYLAFISLGLPDGLLGAAWPSMQQEMNVPISYAGIVSMIIALGTIISSLLSDRLTKRMGSGLVTAISVLLTASALFGFSFSKNYFFDIRFQLLISVGGEIGDSFDSKEINHKGNDHFMNDFGSTWLPSLETRLGFKFLSQSNFPFIKKSEFFY